MSTLRKFCMSHITITPPETTTTRNNQARFESHQGFRTTRAAFGIVLSVSCPCPVDQRGPEWVQEWPIQLWPDLFYLPPLTPLCPAAFSRGNISQDLTRHRGRTYLGIKKYLPNIKNITM